MKITLNWLKDHLETSASVTEITNALVNLGHEVDHIHDPSIHLNNFVVAEVLECEKHPNADKLKLCKVDDGSAQIHQVVCGASNVRSKIKIVFAPEGVIIPSTGKVLKKSIIRGIESSGMICSAEELLLEDNSNGIIELETELMPGSKACEALGENDVIIELSLTPNRADCFSIRGLARDLAALGIGKLKDLPLIDQFKNQESRQNLTIESQTNNCSYFTARTIHSLQNLKTPPLIQKRLLAISQNIISPIVDIVNYICFDIGQPLHVYNFDVTGTNIIVRSARNDEIFNSLKGEEHKLKEDMTIVANKKEILSLAGIMGGESSCYNENVTDILLESAHFSPQNISITGQKINILSDSRTRFERGVDPELVEYALNLATQYIMNISCCIPSPIVQYGNKPNNSKNIKLSIHSLKRILGEEISKPCIFKSLEALGFKIQSNENEEFIMTTPSWRHDIKEEVDIIEEVARIVGYNQFASASLPPKDSPPMFDQSDSIRTLLSARQLHEIISWSFISRGDALLFGKGIEIKSPLSNDMAIMKPSILPGLLKSALINQNKSQFNCDFFEISHIYTHSHEKINENSCVAAIRTQQTHSKHWTSSPSHVDIYHIKADALAVLKIYGVQNHSYEIEPFGPQHYHPGRVGTIKQGKKVLGYFGEIHPNIINHFGLKGPIVACEIMIEELKGRIGKKKYDTKLSSYQAVDRDFSFVLNKDIPVMSLINCIQKLDKSLIQNVDVFDLYEGNNLPQNKKSVALRVHMQHMERTLQEDDLNTISQKIIHTICSTYDAEVR